MARIKPITPDEATGEAAEVYQMQLGQFGRVSQFTQTLAYAPAAARAWGVANKGVRLRYLDEDLEFLAVEQAVIVRTSAVNRSEYCLGHNVDLAEEIGITEEALAAIQGDYASTDLLTDEQKTAIRWADAVTEMTARDDDDLYAEMQRHFSDRRIVELTVLIGMWNFSNRFTEALHVELEPRGQRLNFYPQGTPQVAQPPVT